MEVVRICGVCGSFVQSVPTGFKVFCLDCRHRLCDL